MKRIAIYGAGSFGKYILNELEKQSKYEPTVFIDNYKNGQSWDRRGPKIVSVDLFKKDWADKCDAVIISVEKRDTAQAMTLSLLPWFSKGIYIPDEHVFMARLPLFDKKGDFCPYIRRYIEIKPVLSYVEHDLTKFCNLKCKNCGHRADEVNEIIRTDKIRFTKSLNGIKNLFSNVQVIRLMGGEPFVLDDLDWYITKTREIFRESDIAVVTNGLLIPNLNDNILLALKNNRIIVHISQYPPTRKIINQIIFKLNSVDIKYLISRPIESFMERKEKNNYDERVETIYTNCPNYHCHMLSNGRLYGCGIIKELIDNKYNDNEKKIKLFNNTVDLDNPKMNGWDALMILERPNELCGYCFEEANWVEWESTINKL